jgi:hypothetical protein
MFRLANAQALAAEGRVTETASHLDETAERLRPVASRGRPDDISTVRKPIRIATLLVCGASAGLSATAAAPAKARHQTAAACHQRAERNGDGRGQREPPSLPGSVILDPLQRYPQHALGQALATYEPEQAFKVRSGQPYIVMNSIGSVLP